MIPRRIAYVLPYFPGLTQTFVAAELADLRRRGTQLCVLSLKHSPDLRHDFIARERLDERVIYGQENFRAALSEFRPELIHAHFARQATAAARSLAAEFELPFTFTAHGFDIYFQAPADFAERAAAAAALVTVSEVNARYIAERFGVPRERISVIPCGVDTTRFHPARPAGDPSPWPHEAARPPLVLCVARHHPVKNLRLLLEACTVLRDHEVSFRCVMIGDGPERSELEAIREHHGLRELVEMAGAADHDLVLAWLQRASVAVLSSQSEGMPVSLMEAGACELPVVATRVGGIPELVEDGVTGLLTPPGDAPALARALERLLANPQLRIEMGQAARRRVEAHFSLAMQVDRLLALWSKVLAGRRRSAS
jgi:colanic acid/amylovoran biosynthesis glycosyltransferase